MFYIIFKELSFFRDYAREKLPLRGSKYADKLNRFQLSGVRKASRKILKPQFSNDMLTDKGP